ncbi:hypothetical protein, conserved [Leishmania tarentolae]|uniref:Uncharacterized protein n=1 Tax=Leishmania tarentolae TaxID=5689 RepID=A0A640KBS2_LEITA|nr:hypothetical protein, conserved [Leishmania tarentolae]
MRSSRATRFVCDATPSYFRNAQSISCRCMGSVRQCGRYLLLSSEAKVFMLQRGVRQRKDVVSVVLRTPTRWVSSLLPPAAPPFLPAPACELSTGSASDSGRMPATSHNVDGQVVTQFSELRRQRAWRALRRLRHRQRQRYVATASRESGTELIEVATSRSASSADAPVAANGTACVHKEPACASPLLNASTSDAHSAMPPVQQRLCQLIGTGAWREALEVLRCYEQEGPTTTQQAQAPRQSLSASAFHLHGSEALTAAEDADAWATVPFPFVSLQEVSVWMLLWCGHGTAAWHVWRRTMETASWPSSPRLLLLLAFFTHVVERDTMRTRDMLLLLEMLSCRITTPPSEVKMGQMREGNPSPPCHVWRHIFWQWLSCCNECTDPSKSPSPAHRHCLASLLGRAVEELEKSTLSSSAIPPGPHMEAMAETVALLLLALRDVHCTSDEWRRMLKEELATVCEGKRKQMTSDSRRSVSGELCVRGSTHLPLPSSSVCRLMGEVVKSILLGSSSAADDVRRNDAESAEEKGHMRLRVIFRNAEHNLKRLRGHGSSPVPENDEDALQTFRMWHERIVKSEGLGGTWEELLLAMRQPPEQPQAFNLNKQTIPDDAASASLKQLLQRIDDATRQGDWTTALRLCLNHSFCDGLPYSENMGNSGVDAQDPMNEAVTGPCRYRPSTPTPLLVDPFSFLHRLTRGLTACEVARPPGASWQGALALWNFLRQYSHHHMDCASPSQLAVAAVTTPESLHSGSQPTGPAPRLLSLSRALGRIFVLLASAGRWAEALACFHETPDVYLDGFVVSQVAYALRDCPSQQRVVLDLWATWRCRVGDAVDPTEMMVHKLLFAMLHTSAKATSPVATLSSTSYQSPPMLASKVATALLIAAGNASPVPSTLATSAQNTAVTPGTAVPLDWSRRHRTVRSVIEDRWVGSWADALRVAQASCDASLLVHTLLKWAPAGHSPNLYPEMWRILQEKGVVLSLAERAALLAPWGEERRLGLGCKASASAGKDLFLTGGGSVSTNAEGDGVRQLVLHTEAFLDELLGLD